MDVDTLIDALRTAVQASASDDCIKTYANGPGGRAPATDLVALSQWFYALPDSDRAMVREVADDVSHAAVFGFLCVLDGVRAVEGYGPKGELELWYTKDGKRTLLNPPNGKMLHDIFNAV